MLRTLAVVLLFTMPNLVVASLPVEAHGCRAPVRPPDDVDEATWEKFLAGVDGYRACISDFVAANHRAADAHRAAANGATEAWNGFVRDSLNVPEANASTFAMVASVIILPEVILAAALRSTRMKPPLRTINRRPFTVRISMKLAFVAEKNPAHGGVSNDA